MGAQQDPKYGLYELIKDQRLETILQSHPHADASYLKIEKADAPEYLARHFSLRLKHALSGMELPAQVELINTLLQAVPESDSLDQVSPGPEFLGEIRRTGTNALHRPQTPLSDVALLTNSPGEPNLGSQVAREIESADRVDLLCAFIKWSGIRTLETALERLAARKVPLRILTTTYIGATDRRALDRLADRYNAEIRVNYSSKATRLHAKAWLFHRDSGFSTAYVGSSNLSRDAIVDGMEWNVRLSSVVTGVLLEKFNATFDSYWGSYDFEAYDPRTDGDRLDEALRQAGRMGSDVVVDISHLDVQPYPHQQVMLTELEAARDVHGHHENLVVAATGTGKTVLAALDYRNLQLPGQPHRTLLFAAHRKEILEQARRTYREVLHDGSFGELYVDGARPVHWKHVFASVQSLSNAVNSGELDPGAFDIIVIDEFHHATAATYRNLLGHFQPQELLGLTATPERSDGTSVAVEFFAGRITSELRLWDALSADLLVPFHYFGIADDVDLARLRFTRRGYEINQLEKVYTGNSARTAIIISALRDKVGEVGTMRALGFCVSVAHATYMAQEFNRVGIPAAALSGESSSSLRSETLGRLRRGEINCVFAVDLFNEGLDIPMVDTILMLRPTESATLFLQQLGRGLRRAHGKAVLTVLDFVGQQHASFRFDLKYRALTGLSRKKLAKAIEAGFPFLPSGSQIILDRVSSDIVLSNVRQQVGMRTGQLINDVRDHKPKGTSPAEYGLAKYLDEADRELSDIYGRGAFQEQAVTWSMLKARAFPLEIENDAALGKNSLYRRLKNFTHVDDEIRAAGYVRLLESTARIDALGPEDRILAAMLFYTFWPRAVPVGTNEKLSLDEGLRLLRSDPHLREELSAVLQWNQRHRSNIVRRATSIIDGFPLVTHAHYTREELLAAIGVGTYTSSTPGDKREGVVWVEKTRTEALLVTLKKSDADFSPNTMYRDYAINNELFHWESQNNASPATQSGQRYVAGDDAAVDFQLFVREAKDDDTGTAPYVYLGKVDYVSHQGEKPMAITWKLERDMPGDVFSAARAVAG